MVDINDFTSPRICVHVGLNLMDFCLRQLRDGEFAPGPRRRPLIQDPQWECPDLIPLWGHELLQSCCCTWTQVCLTQSNLESACSQMKNQQSLHVPAQFHTGPAFAVDSICLFTPTAPEHFHLFTVCMCEHTVDSTPGIPLPGWQIM